MSSSPPREAEALVVVGAFNRAFGRLGVDEVMDLMTEDCILENTLPVFRVATARWRRSSHT